MDRIDTTRQGLEFLRAQSDLACSTSTNGAEPKSPPNPKAHGDRPGS